MDGWSATSLGLPLPSSFVLFSSLLSELWRVIEAAFVGLIKLRSVARARVRVLLAGRGRMCHKLHNGPTRRLCLPSSA